MQVAVKGRQQVLEIGSAPDMARQMEDVVWLHGRNELRHCCGIGQIHTPVALRCRGTGGSATHRMNCGALGRQSIAERTTDETRATGNEGG